MAAYRRRYGPASLDGGTAPPTGPVVTGASDAAVLADARARLYATGEFSAVSRNRPFELETGHHAMEEVSCDVSPGIPWANLDSSGEFAGVRLEHTGRLVVALAVRDEDHEARWCRLSRLEAIVNNTLNGQSLAGVTVPGRTLCMRGTYPTAQHPEQRSLIGIDYEYLVNGYAGFDTTEVP